MSRPNASKIADTQAQSPEAYSDFEVSVLKAAAHQAELMVAKAQKESDERYHALVNAQKTDLVAAHRTEGEAALRRKIAGAKQENRKKLLIYRKQLVNGLFAEANEDVIAFTQTPAYTEFLVKSLQKHADKITNGCIVYLKNDDMSQQNAISAVLPACQFQADPTILLGGAKLVTGRILYDETIDDALHTERTHFLTRCHLRVEAEGTDENK
ncbi:MAG: V-type ATP synthase subunit E family protein [Ruthenibacterium sp.]